MALRGGDDGHHPKILFFVSSKAASAKPKIGKLKK